MKYLLPLCLLLSASGLQAQSAPTREQLTKWLKQYPKADANGDGVLTAKEALAYRAKTQKSKRPQQGVKTQFKVHPGWKADRFPEHAMCYRTPEELKTAYPDIASFEKPEDGALRIIGTGHSFMQPGYKALPAICRAAGFEQPLLTHIGGGMTGSARYKWEEENGIFQFEGKPKPKLLASIANAEWDVMMWGPYFQDRPEYYACWIDFCLKYHPDMTFYISDAWPSLLEVKKRPQSEKELTNAFFAKLGKAKQAQSEQLMGALHKAYPGKVSVIPTSAAMILAVEHFHRGELPGIEGIHRTLGKKQRSLWVDTLGHLGPGLDLLEGYVFYATLYAKSPELIADKVAIDKNTNNFPSPELDQVFRKIAWQAVISNPLSGVTDKDGDGVGDTKK